LSGIAENFRPNLAGKREKHKKKKSFTHSLSLLSEYDAVPCFAPIISLSVSLILFLVLRTEQQTSLESLFSLSLSLCFFFEFVRRVRSVQLWPSFRSWGESSSLPFSFSLLIKSKPLDLLISFTVFFFVFLFCDVLWLAAEKVCEKRVAEKLMKVGSLSFYVFGSRESGSFYLTYSNAASLKQKNAFYSVFLGNYTVLSLVWVLVFA
jgi:hypothetical protein